MGIGSYIFFGVIAVAFMMTIIIVVAVWRGTSPDWMWKSNGKKQFDASVNMLNELKERQKKMAEDIAEIRERTGNIEKILREVE